MTLDEYERWVDGHRSLFNLFTEHDSDMFAAWWPLLSRYPFEDAVAASRWMIVNHGGIYRTEQLAMLRRRMATVELDRLNSVTNVSSPCRCQLCANTGFIIVPHLRFCHNDEWLAEGGVYHDMSVLCNCKAGRAIASKQASYVACNPEVRRSWQTMTLEKYEERNPTWRQQLCDRDNAMQDEALAKNAALKAHRFFTDFQRVSERMTGTSTGPSSKE